LKQAESAAKAIKEQNIKVERVVCSPMLRACQTGDCFADAFEINIEQDRAIISWALGFLQGRDKKEYADILDLYVGNPKLTIPDGESLDDFEQRNFDYLEVELKKEEKLTVFCTHNSNCVALNKFIDKDFDGKAESDERSVKPGGVLGVYVDESGEYSVDILHGKEKTAEFGT
jgi:broad specificity phosphatase PhoE